MSGVKTTHRQAMEQTDLALAARHHGDEALALRHFRKAYELEAEAAAAYATRLDAEPTRSVLFRSAATLALDCGLLPEAEKLVCTALIGSPPETSPTSCATFWNKSTLSVTWRCAASHCSLTKSRCP